MTQARDMLGLLRPHQWIKNGFVLLPPFFAFKIADPQYILPLAAALAGFCLVSGAAYIHNDIHDLEYDSRHPTKRFRPLANGRVSVALARRVMAWACLAGLAAGALAGLKVFGVLVAYGVLNVLYSRSFKHVAVLDVCCIAAGFVVRVFAGAFAACVTASHWIVLMTFLLAMFLALAKRRFEAGLAVQGNASRKCIDGYTVEFASAAMVLMAGVTIVSYIMYTVAPATVQYYGSDDVYLTSFFIILGILRYMQLSFVGGGGASPSSVLLKDRFLQATIAGWLAMLGFLLYF